MRKLFTLLLAGFFIYGASAQKPRINHVAFSVSNLQKSTAFYQQIIGLDTIPEPFHDGRHIWFSIGDRSHLHLIQNPPPIVVPGKQTHLCLTVPSVDAFVQRLQQAGIAYEDWPGKKGAITIRVDKVKQVYLQDPDGYWVEINDARD